MCSELLHLDGVIVVISSRLQNGDVVLMVQEHCVMPVAYVLAQLKDQSNIIDYAKVSKRNQREGHHQQDEMTNGHNTHQDDRQ